MKFDKEHLAVTLSALVVGVVVGGGAGYAIRPIPEPETVEVEKKLSWFQKTQIAGFWTLLVFLMIVYRKKIFGTLVRRILKK